MGKSVAVVIATVGSESIISVLDSISNSLSRNFIYVYVVLPPESVFEEKARQLIGYFSLCGEILIADQKGQVAQRSYALRRIRNEVILQMDDDITISGTTIDNLINDIYHFGPYCAIGPRIDYPDNPPKLKFFKRAVYRYFYGLSAENINRGKILRFGISNYPSKFLTDYTLVEWLPGGCVGYFRIIAVTENYFPFNGKAFYEDVVASVLRARKGVLHLINSDSITIEKPLPLRDFASVKGNISARNYLNKILGKKYILNIANVIDILGFLVRKFFSFFSLKIVNIVRGPRR